MTWRTCFTSGLSSALVLMLLSGCSAGKSFTLAFAPEVGEKRILEVDNDFAVAFTVLGQTASAGVRGGRRMLVKVTDVAPDGLVSMSMTFTEVRLDADLGAMDAFDFVDGASLDPGDYRDVIQGVVGETVNLKLTPDGEIRYIMGIHDLPDRLLHKAEVPYGPKRNTLAKLLKDEFSQSTFEEGVTEIFSAYRSAPTKEGDTWQETQSIATEFPVELRNNFVLTSLQGGAAQVRSTINVSGNESVESEILPGLSATVSLSGTGASDYRLNTDTTWLEEYTSHIDVPGSASVSIPGLGSITMNLKLVGSSSARMLPADSV